MKRKSLLPNTAVPNLPLPQFAELGRLLANNGFLEWSLSSKNGTQSLTAKRKDGKTFNYSEFEIDGFQERSVAQSVKTNIKQRQAAAKLLNKKGLTQMEIAKRLGVSQKTISNDLRTG